MNSGLLAGKHEGSLLSSDCEGFHSINVSPREGEPESTDIRESPMSWATSWPHQVPPVYGTRMQGERSLEVGAHATPGLTVEHDVQISLQSPPSRKRRRFVHRSSTQSSMSRSPAANSIASRVAASGSS